MHFRMHEAMIFYLFFVAARKWPSPRSNLVNTPPSVRLPLLPMSIQRRVMPVLQGGICTRMQTYDGEEDNNDYDDAKDDDVDEDGDSAAGKNLKDDGNGARGDNLDNDGNGATDNTIDDDGNGTTDEQLWRWRIRRRQR